MKRRVLLGTFALSKGYADEFYGKALRVRRLFRRAFEQAFERVDVLVGATSPVPAFPLGERAGDPLTMYLCDVLTTPASLAGLPAVSVPCGRTAAGLPVGVQFVGPALKDVTVLSAAFAYEQKSGWKGQIATRAAELLA